MSTAQNTTARPACFACGRPMGMMHSRYTATTRDGQTVWVGASCASKIIGAGEAGWQPPKGGPRLWSKVAAPITTAEHACGLEPEAMGARVCVEEAASAVEAEARRLLAYVDGLRSHLEHVRHPTDTAGELRAAAAVMAELLQAPTR